MLTDIQLDGVSLFTYAYHVKEISEGVGIPGKRGNNIVVPYRSGARFVKKPYTERRFVYAMWVVGRDKDTGQIGSPSGTKFKDNLDELFSLLGKEGMFLKTYVYEDTSQRTIPCELTADLWLGNLGHDGADMIIEMIAPYPFFEAVTKTEQTYTLDDTSKTVYLENPGTAPTRKAIVTATGDISDLKIENKTTDTWVRCGGDLVSDTLVIDVGDYSAELGGDNVAGAITHAGDPSFLVIAAGVNEIEITTANDPPDGTVKIEFYAPYF